jgi:carbon-monoxide dehydrogenase small subunit
VLESDVRPHGSLTIRLQVNGEETEGEVEGRTTLADFLRDQLGLTGTHLGCEHGVCGACTVLLDSLPARSCLVLAASAEGSRVETVEGLAGSDELSRLQRAMWDSHSFQCGFCTPGFLIQAAALLAENPSPTEAEVRHALSGNLCRCTGYESIVRGVVAAVEGPEPAGSGPR